MTTSTPVSTKEKPSSSAAGAPEKATSGNLLRAVKDKWALALVVAVILGLVQLSSMILPPFLFPGLGDIAMAVVDILANQKSDILITMARFVVSLVVAIAAGWIIGLVMGAFRSTVGALFTPLFSIMQAVPALSWVLLAVLWISDINIRIGFICFAISMPLIAIAVYEGIRNIDPEIVEAVDQFRPTKLQALRMLLIPQSVVYMIMSLRSTTAFTLRILVFAELIGAASGIGQRMQVAQTNFQLDMIFAWTFLLILVNFALVYLIDVAEKHLLAWRGEAVIR
ncbi:ABC transporter permease subunit [Nocardiopsis sp. ATB16-24]|uniref:ABC transporter permease n=1 Tax=Nocardiopsis sp. ATB16-24 TaxID=3019555 RepID=UPI002553FC6C|nr:ABC transporter permease subunit [Nocardiopsis sp. ATB16-24]